MLVVNKIIPPHYTFSLFLDLQREMKIAVMTMFGQRGILPGTRIGCRTEPSAQSAEDRDRYFLTSRGKPGTQCYASIAEMIHSKGRKHMIALMCPEICPRIEVNIFLRGRRRLSDSIPFSALPPRFHLDLKTSIYFIALRYYRKLNEDGYRNPDCACSYSAQVPATRRDQIQL